MPKTDCRRESIRVAVNNDDYLEAIIYSEEGIPELCDEYEINLGGIKVNALLNAQKNMRVRVSLFNNTNTMLRLIAL